MDFKRNNKIRNIIRICIRFFFFITMPAAFVSGFNGVKHIFSCIGDGEPIVLNSFIKVLILLLAFTILFDRFFCGYVCSFGSFGDFIHWLSCLFQKKILKRKKEYCLSKPILKVLQKIKYIILALIVIFCFLGVYGRFTGWNPWEVFSLLQAGNLKLNGYVIGILLMILIIIGMSLQERFFCQVLCPMGAVFSLMPVLPVSKMHREEDGCLKNCSACEKKCPVSLKLSENNIRSGECISCGKCVGSCPKKNIKTGFTANIQQEIIFTVFKALVFFIIGALIGILRFTS